MRFGIPRNDYQKARKIGLPIFISWIANTITILGALILRDNQLLSYCLLPEAFLSILLYLIISRNPVPKEELSK